MTRSSRCRECIESIADDSDLAEVHASARHPPYVASTRTRDHPLITGVGPASEIPDDFIDEPMQTI
jgi:hypothetical protein